MRYYLDGHNIGRWIDPNYISQNTILTLLVELKKRGNDGICFFDADIHHLIREQGEEDIFLKYFDKGKYKVVPGGVQADKFILMAAENDNARIISNDRFKHSLDKYPWLKNDYLPQRLFKGTILQNMLMIPDLDINVPVETNIKKLLAELELKKIQLDQPDLEIQKNMGEIPGVKIPYSNNEIQVLTSAPVKPKSLSHFWISILIIVIGIAVFFYYNSRSTNDNNGFSAPQNIQEPINNSTRPVPTPQIPECETNNTGDYTFVNKTNRKIYLFLNSAGYSKTLEIGPRQKITEYGMNANDYFNKYRYSYSYFTESNYDRGSIDGEITIEKCINKSLELELPPCYSYKLFPDVWKEIEIPNGCCYTVVMPYKRFMIRFGSDSTDHYSNSFLDLPQDIGKIYLKSDYNDVIETSIMKDIENTTQN